MKEVLIVIVGILIVIFIIVYVASEANYEGWMECYNRMREIDDSYIEFANAYLSGLEKQVKNYEEYTKQLTEHIDILEREIAELRGEDS